MASALSTVHRGVAFEQRAQRALRTLSMVLERIGGRDDGGIDLQGWWFLPHPLHPAAHPGPAHPLQPTALPHPSDSPASSQTHRQLIRLRVLAQCKAESKKMGPNYVREMEGVLARHRFDRLHRNNLNTASPCNSSQRDGDGDILDRYSNDIFAGTQKTTETASETGSETEAATIALLVSQSAFTKSTLLRALSSPIPFLLVHLPPVSETFHPGTLPSSSNADQNLIDTIADSLPRHPAHTHPDRIDGDVHTGNGPSGLGKSLDRNPLRQNELSIMSTAKPLDPCSSSQISLAPDSHSLGSIGIGSAIWNPALGGSNGLLRGQFDLRWERDLAAAGEGAGRPALWMGRKRVEPCIPIGYSDPIGDLRQEEE